MIFCNKDHMSNSAAMSKLKVLVVGASIAGPTAAYWFAKAGASVTVIERFSELRTGGQAIDIRTSGVTVMRRMPGMEAAVRAKAAPMEGISFVREDGRPYGILKPTGNPDQQSLVSEYEIFRGDLSEILVGMSKDNENVKYIFGEQIRSIQQDEKANGPVTVEFANGLATAQYDLVVACDGATSRTRALGLGCGARDYVHPTGSWAAFFTLKKNLFPGSKLGQAFTAPGGRFIAAGSDALGVTRATLMGVNRQDDNDTILRFREAMKEGNDAIKQFLAQHYKGVGWKTSEILAAMEDAPEFYANESVQIKPPTLYKGRFVMVGDAGYAPGNTGTGTTLALTGAYVLAGEIGKHRGDLAAGLRGYEERMRPIINEMQKAPSFVLSFVAPQTARGIWLRNHIFALITWTRIMDFAGFIASSFASSFASTEQYPLPEYEWVE